MPNPFLHPNRAHKHRHKGHPEADLQEACVDWFRRTHKNEVIFYVANELAYDRASEMKKRGLLRGVSDLVVLLKDGRALFCELKSDDGKQSREQRAFQLKVERLGFKYYIIKTLEEFKYIVNEQ